jgi:hypothetical protein
MYTFWEIVASNSVVATILAIGAMLLGRIWKNAAAIHVLWVVVLLKLFTPPLLTTGIPFAVTIVPSGAIADSHEKILSAPAPNKVRQIPLVVTANDRGAIAAGNPQRTQQNAFTKTAGRKP